MTNRRHRRSPSQQTCSPWEPGPARILAQDCPKYTCHPRPSHTAAQAHACCSAVPELCPLPLTLLWPLDHFPLSLEPKDPSLPPHSSLSKGAQEE